MTTHFKLTEIVVLNGYISNRNSCHGGIDVISTQNNLKHLIIFQNNVIPYRHSDAGSSYIFTQGDGNGSRAVIITS